MEIAPDIHLIPGSVGTRPLQLFLLRGDTHVVLLDTGTATDPQRTILPYLESIGLAPTDVDLVIDTHADADHVGGNAAMKRANPHLMLTCGEGDRELIENPQAMIARRYRAYESRHAISPDAAVRQWFVETLGEPQPVDWTWRGGETLRVGRDWLVEIHHTPGHSAGHLTVLDPRSRTLLIGDAVHGGIGRDRAGNPAFPTYTQVEPYLGTLNYLRALDAQTVAGCHWTIARGAEVQAFLNASEQYVYMLDALLLAELARRRDGATLRELIQSVGSSLTGGRPVPELELVYTFAANLQQLAAQGRAIQDDTVRPVRYHLA